MAERDFWSSLKSGFAESFADRDSAATDADGSASSTAAVAMTVRLAKPLGVVLEEMDAGGVFVERILVGGHAQRTGDLQLGDVLCAIGERECRFMDVDAVCDLIEDSAAAGFSASIERQPLPAGWREATADSGKPYYYRRGDGSSTQWERPGASSAAAPPLPPPPTVEAVSTAAPEAPESPESTPARPFGNLPNPFAAAPPPAAPPSTTSALPLPSVAPPGPRGFRSRLEEKMAELRERDAAARGDADAEARERARRIEQLRERQDYLRAVLPELEEQVEGRLEEAKAAARAEEEDEEATEAAFSGGTVTMRLPEDVVPGQTCSATLPGGWQVQFTAPADAKPGMLVPMKLEAQPLQQEDEE